MRRAAPPPLWGGADGLDDAHALAAFLVGRALDGEAAQTTAFATLR